MRQQLFIILSVLGFALFFVMMFFTTGDKNKAYIKYVLLSFPIVNITLLPNMGPSSIFDYVTVIFLFVFYKPKTTNIDYGKTYLVMFILLTLVAITGVINAETLSTDTLTACVQYFTIFCFAKILVDECIADESFFDTVLSYLKIIIIVSLLFLGVQLIIGPQFSLSRIQNVNVISSLGVRYPGFFQDPQKYAQFLAITSFILLLKNRGAKKLPSANILLLLLTIAGMLLTGSRAGFGGWCLGILIIIFFGKSQYRITGIALSIAILGLVYFFAEDFTMFNRFSSLGDDYEFRHEIWKDAINIFKDNPYFGIGMGNYANYVAIHNPDQFWEADVGISFFNHPESGYLKFLAEFGLLGFSLLYCLILLPAIIAFYKFFKTKDSSNIFLIAALASWLVGFYTVYSFDDTRMRISVATVICLLITNYKRLTPENAN